RLPGITASDTSSRMALLSEVPIVSQNSFRARAFPFPFPFALVLALIAAAASLPSVAAAQNVCPDYVPTDCTVLQPGDSLPTRVTKCYRIDEAGTGPYVETNVNVLDGGAIYFVEDPGKTIDFQVSALLVEKGGVVQAGSPNCPFGKDGG